MKITKDMVRELNELLAEVGCIFKFEFCDREINPVIEVVPKSSAYLDSYVINLTSEFYEVLKEFFAQKGITLACNNTGSTWWSANGWE